MSSFNIGPTNQPLVQSSQNLGKDGGGGGNTGYMNMRGKKKGKKNENEEDNSVFLEEQIEDTFEKQGGKRKTKDGKILGAISKFIKDRTAPKKGDDSFVKSKEAPKKEENEPQEEDDEDYSAYNIPVNKTVDPLEDDEYEVVEDDDDYYDDIDV